MTPNSEDDNKQVEQQVTVDDILQQDNNTDTFTLYGYCPNCKEIHGDLNRIVEREKFPNLGLGYEHIPGLMVAPIEHVPQDPTGIEGLEGFVHLAFEPVAVAPDDADLPPA